MIYKGPYTQVYDEEGYIFPRGKHIAVCERTFCFLTMGPYNDNFIGISPAILRELTIWCAPAGILRPVRETKGGIHKGSSSTALSCCS